MGSSGSQARKLHKPFNTCAQKPYRIVYWGDQLRDTDNPLDIEIVWFVCPWRLFSFQFCGKENCINVSRKWRCLKFRHYFCISGHIHNAQTKGTLHKLMVKSVHKGRWLLTVVDPEDMRNIPPPFPSPIAFIFMQFQAKIMQNTIREILNPPLRTSWSIHSIVSL